MLNLTDVWVWYSTLDPWWLRIVIGVFTAVGAHMALKIPEWLWRQGGHALARGSKGTMKSAWKHRKGIARSVVVSAVASAVVWGLMSVPWSAPGKSDFRNGEYIQVVSPISDKQGQVGIVINNSCGQRQIRFSDGEKSWILGAEMKEISQEEAVSIVEAQKRRLVQHARPNQ